MNEIQYADLDHGITTIDTGYQRAELAASHLLVQDEHAAFVDVGTALSVPRLLAVLRAKEISREHVDYVIVTHVHLDHAGGAGALMRHLPNARLVVHPRGARHMIDPAKLIAGAAAVYGESAMRARFGEILPVPAERVIEAADEFVLSLAERPLRFLDTPGHARHHFCVVDETSRGIFTGDTFGLAYPQLHSTRGAFIFPTTTPVQFEPEALHASVDRLAGYGMEYLYLTHYGRVTDVPRLAEDLHHRIDALVNLALESNVAGEDRQQRLLQGMEAILLRELDAHGVTLSREESLALMAMDLELNAQGLAVWLDRQPQGRGPSNE
jgi:glyoxylase-like metal-dependent hydrolase (beta-lactamase superfamily II)